MRLQGYDYRQAGGYFVTVHTQGWQHLFGKITDGEMLLNDFGRIVQRIWLNLPDHYTGIELDEYVVMPNHFHGIVFINGLIKTRSLDDNLVSAGLKPALTKGINSAPAIHSISEVVRALKTFSAREINKMRHTPGIRVWQKDFYDRIIRSEEELDRVRDYIRSNSARFTDDK